MNAKRKPRSASSPQEPFVISSEIPFNFPILPIGWKVFKNPWSLPHFKALQHQRSLPRLLLLKSCVTGLCWLPLYVAFALQLSSVKYPQELHFFIHWLIFLPSSISPFFSLCGTNFSRRILRRAAYYVLNTCACGLHKVQFQTAKSDDEIEGARLLHVRPLQTEILWQIFWGKAFKKNLYIRIDHQIFWRGWVDYHQSKFILRYRNWLSKYIQAVKRKYMQKLKLWSISVQKKIFKRGSNFETWAHIPTQNIPSTPGIYTSLALWMRCQPTVHRRVILSINSPVLIWHLQWRVARWE